MEHFAYKPGRPEGGQRASGRPASEGRSNSGRSTDVRSKGGRSDEGQLDDRLNYLILFIYFHWATNHGRVYYPKAS